MNKLIADIFGSLLSLLHILVIVALILVYFAGIEKGFEYFYPFVNQFGIDYSNFKWFWLGVIIVLSIFYVIFAGLTSTIVSIHEQLVKLNNRR